MVEETDIQKDNDTTTLVITRQQTFEASSGGSILENIIACLEPEFYDALSSLGTRFSDNGEYVIDVSNIELTGTIRYNAFEEKYRKNPEATTNELIDAILLSWFRTKFNQEKRVSDYGRFLPVDDGKGLIDSLLWISSTHYFDIDMLISPTGQKILFYTMNDNEGKQYADGNIVAPPQAAYITVLNQCDAETWNYVLTMKYIAEINRRSFALGYARDDIIEMEEHDALGFPTKIRFKPQNIISNKARRINEDARKVFVCPLNLYIG